jgi:hypothetical protein
MLVDKQPFGVERLAVQFEQIQPLCLVLQHAPGGFRAAKTSVLPFESPQVTNGRVLGALTGVTFIMLHRNLY